MRCVAICENSVFAGRTLTSNTVVPLEKLVTEIRDATHALHFQLGAAAFHNTMANRSTTYNNADEPELISEILNEVLEIQKSDSLKRVGEVAKTALIYSFVRLHRLMCKWMIPSHDLIPSF